MKLASNLRINTEFGQGKPGNHELDKVWFDQYFDYGVLVNEKIQSRL
jgi:hypothetical protein